jgi:hypothetical protein
VSDLVLKTRVAVALDNLSRLTNLPNMMGRRDQRMTEILELPQSLRAQVQELFEVVLGLRQLELPDETPDALAQGLSQLDTQLAALRTVLTRRAAQVKRLRGELAALTGDRKDVDQFLVLAADELGKSLSVDNYWKQRRRCDALFSEYVDYLRGVAIRSTGFGDESGMLSDLFLLADSLPALWGRPGGRAWNSLAIPSRVEQNASTEAFVLRIGFPEWTIWALPLLQHEFGHVVIKSNPRELPTASERETARPPPPPPPRDRDARRRARRSRHGARLRVRRAAVAP